MNLPGAEPPLPTPSYVKADVMLRPVVVGLDGSPESFTAANWAAREAQRRGLPLSLVHAWLRQAGDLPAADSEDTVRHWAQRILRDGGKELTGRYPELPLTAEQVPATAVTALLERAEGAEMLVLGSRGLSALTGFLLGAVGQQVLARATCPVVMVRANERSTAERPGDEVVVALQNLKAAPGRCWTSRSPRRPRAGRRCGPCTSASCRRPTTGTASPRPPSATWTVIWRAR